MFAIKLIFKNPQTNEELVLPVTPPSFEVASGIKGETVNIHTVGDVVIGGYGTLANIKIDCMFPAQQYPFVVGPSIKPYEYVNKIKLLCESRTVVRFIVTDTPVNIPALILEIAYGERDGTGDVYATITMREYKYLTAAKTQKQDKTGNEPRPVEAAPPPAMQTYIIVKGDTLWAICRRFYGEPKLCYDLAKYNGIKNANLIYAGNTLNIPDKSLLESA